jgi:ferric-dicitrate binding protein FerR (iron transport regulator)
MNRQQAKSLLKKYNSGTASKEEQIQLEQWYYKEQAGQKLSEEETDFILLKNEIWQGTLYRSGLSNIPSARTVKLWKQIAVASFILLAISFGFYFYLDNDRSSQYVKHKKIQDIAPGGNKAILTLADGRKISLTDAGNGELLEQSGIKITKTSDGQLVYSPVRSDVVMSSAEHSYNIIETPRGGQYKIILPDGTGVWLNAASTLRYSTKVGLLAERWVELQGEAYFEVAKLKDRSFKVRTKGQEIEVLGTHFNVSRYPEESNITTTLLEGSVRIRAISSFAIGKIRKGVMLKPGQQAILNNRSIRVREVDPEEAVAWKNGFFRFDDEKLEEIMAKISRWYDVEVTYKDTSLRQERFAAVTTRFANVSVLLRMMQETSDVKFTIEGKRIVISR